MYTNNLGTNLNANRAKREKLSSKNYTNDLGPNLSSPSHSHIDGRRATPEPLGPSVGLPSPGFRS